MSRNGSEYQVVSSEAGKHRELLKVPLFFSCFFFFQWLMPCLKDRVE